MYEDDARKELEIREKININRCGLFVDKEIYYLGASPDGIVGDDHIVKIKCPYTAYIKKMTPNDAIEQKIIKAWKKNSSGEIVLNKNHDWYYKIQGQLHITGKKTCILGVWTGHGEIKIEYINKDDHFWKQKMENALKSFYVKCLLPEIVDPRQSRNLPIRTIIL
jgi:hypothetical protein